MAGVLASSEIDKGRLLSCQHESDSAALSQTRDRQYLPGHCITLASQGEAARVRFAVDAFCC